MMGAGLCRTHSHTSPNSHYSQAWHVTTSHHRLTLQLSVTGSFLATVMSRGCSRMMGTFDPEDAARVARRQESRTAGESESDAALMLSHVGGACKRPQ